jgi:hypothetical protein
MEQQRRHPRKRVHLRVTYDRAQDFVEQYAVNLSAGGLFLAGAQVEKGEEVSITIELPGHGTLTLLCEVMHVAAEGAGLQIKTGPRGYAEMLEAYLMRLGRRSEGTVYVNEEPWRTLIADGGYLVQPLPAVNEVRKIFSGLRAIALMPLLEHAEAYSVALEKYEADPELIIPIHADLPPEPVIAWLDERLLG